MAITEIGTGHSGVVLAGDAPIMEGTWQNPGTGHKFTVRDCFFQDGQLVVQTTDGKILDYNTIQHYVQVGNGGPENVQKSKPSPKIAEPLEQQVAMIPEDEGILGNIFMGSQSVSNQPVIQKPTQQDPDMEMVNRILRNKPLPVIEPSITWPGIPTKQFETMVDVLGIDPKTIADYYINKLDPSTVFDTFKKGIAYFVEQVLADSNQSAEEGSGKQVESIPAESPKKEPKKKKK